jgi:predicted AAA+ superfamily ATPase
MIRRQHAPALRRLLRAFPAVTILGPRQCGKTTFIRRALPGWTYLDLDRPSDAAPFAADPEARLAQLGDRLVLDEAQRVPGLFPVLRSLIDRDRKKKGRFVLLGSVSPSLVGQISESLAGRTGFLDLTPFQWSEVSKQGDIGKLWFRGGFPDAFLQRDDGLRFDWLEAYTRTFIERDLAALGIGVSAPQMRKLWTMLAHVHGGLWNASHLAASMGVSYHTVERYVDILEQAFLVRKLPPYHANIGKRLVKSPKVYLRDTGLLHYFLGLRTPGMLDTHPSRGASWEGFVIEQMIHAFREVRPGSQAFFWRTATGEEVDLLVEAGPERIPFEIKLHSAPGDPEARGVRRCMADLGLRRGYVLYPGAKDYSLGSGVNALGVARLLARPAELAQLP